MFVVIFEVQPKTEQIDRYLELAKMLRPELERIDGFIDNERYCSTTRPERILSLSSWRDEKALIRWRTLAVHHRVQEEGRLRVFQNYRLRVGEVRLDTLPPPGLPMHEQRFDVTESSIAKAITITEISPSAKPNSTAAPEPNAPNMIESDVFESIYTPGKKLVLSAWRDTVSAAALPPQPITTRYREVRVIRAYGMYDRTEAPQYYPEVELPAESSIW